MCRCHGLCDRTELMASVRFSMVNQYNVTVAAMTAPANIDRIEGSTGRGEQSYRALNGKRAVEATKQRGHLVYETGDPGCIR